MGSLCECKSGWGDGRSEIFRFFCSAVFFSGVDGGEVIFTVVLEYITGSPRQVACS